MALLGAPYFMTPGGSFTGASPGLFGGQPFDPLKGVTMNPQGQQLFTMTPFDTAGYTAGAQARAAGTSDSLFTPPAATGVSATGVPNNLYASGGGLLQQPAQYNPLLMGGGKAPQQPQLPGNWYMPGAGGQLVGAQGSSVAGNSPDQWLASLGSNLDYLTSIAKNQGNPINQMPAWDAMVAAQQRNIQERAADLAEYFNVSGNRFSTSFGRGMTDFQAQTAKDQNALLGQMVAQALEGAQGRNLAASQGLAQGAFGAGSQLSSQDFQSQMLQMQQKYGAMSQLFGAGTQAAGALAGYGAQGAGQLAAQGMQGGLSLLGASNLGAGQLYGTENAAAMAEVQRQLALQQMGLSGGSALSNMYNYNLGLGSSLGQQQYGLSSDMINRAYQEWMRTQPQYNPMLQYLYNAGTFYPPLYTPGYAPGWLGSALGAAGQIGGAYAGRP